MVSDTWYVRMASSSVYRLNPCCNGIWSLTNFEFLFASSLVKGLNPCCNGIWSLTGVAKLVYSAGVFVLILVVMEYGL